MTPTQLPPPSGAEAAIDTVVVHDRPNSEGGSEALRWSIEALSGTFPEYSARRTMTRRQRAGLLVVLVVLVVTVGRWPIPMGIAAMAVSIAIYSGVLWFRLWLMWRQRDGRDPTQIVTDDEAMAVPDHELPTFSILVPAYRESEVLADLVANLAALDYPIDRVDIHLVLEADDDVTMAAAAAIELPSNFTVIAVPAAEPRTKPKACNYALLQCRGDIVTIYDAEDRPEPLQLRRVAVAFARCGPEVGCIQAELAFYNTDENVITRWFAVDYRVWFTQYLPGLAATDTAIPLGGTSNHVRRELLVAIGAWDPFNVTEDADLGIRLHRRGFRVGIVDSVTYEEANTDLVNWVKQRSRWYKGYLQTWLVHMRHPLRLRRDLGFRGLLRFNLFVGGTPVLAALNPLSWLLLVLWFAFEPQWMLDIMPAPVYYPALATWLGGNFLFYYLNLAAAYDVGVRRVFSAALLLPAYWLLMSLAAVKAVVQLVFDPAYWEKTQHGLSSQRGITRTEVGDVGRGA